MVLGTDYSVSLGKDSLTDRYEIKLFFKDKRGDEHYVIAIVTDSEYELMLESGLFEEHS